MAMNIRIRVRHSDDDFSYSCGNNALSARYLRRIASCAGFESDIKRGRLEVLVGVHSFNHLVLGVITNSQATPMGPPQLMASAVNQNCSNNRVKFVGVL